MASHSILSIAKTTGQIALACTALFALMKARKTSHGQTKCNKADSPASLDNVEQYEPNDLAYCHWLS
ncbi:MAG: hypothetical protein KGQ58_08055 [Proteobacteria bacterium]|nr:hypothetical protein [Pseudomonadota bacterium]MDE3207537.1 hypothetical protein [Pseudomonadota bacterium]